MDAQREFARFLVETGVLAFGDFRTKSGRRTPYFVNTGLFRTGSQLARLAGFYARAIDQRLGTSFDVLFGPAYKGIPLACATAMELSRLQGRDVAYCFDRKEAKDHGEGGRLIGHVLEAGDRVCLVEDVTTAGTSIRQTVPLLRAAAEVELAGLCVAVDRRERGQGTRSALEELETEFDMPAFAIATIDDLVEALRGVEVGGRPVLDEPTLARIAAYRETYGA